MACSRGHAPRVCETRLDDRRTGDRSTLASGDPPAIAFPATPSRRPSTTTARREVDRPQPTRHLPRPTTTGGRLSTRYAAPAGPPPSPGGYGKARPAGSTHDAYGDAAETLMGRTFAQHSTVCTGDVQQTMRCSSTSAKPCATRKPLWGGRLRDTIVRCAGKPHSARVCATRLFDAPETLMGRAFAGGRAMRECVLNAAGGGRFRPVPLVPLRGGAVALLVLLAASARALIVTADLGRFAVHGLGGLAFVAIGAYLPLL